jgi:hypothetical protein
VKYCITGSVITMITLTGSVTFLIISLILTAHVAVIMVVASFGPAD